jgi:hypothetical protein
VRVLVAGTEGYLGCQVAPTVFEDVYDIVGRGDERLSRKGC